MFCIQQKNSRQFGATAQPSFQRPKIQMQRSSVYMWDFFSSVGNILVVWNTYLAWICLSTIPAWDAGRSKNNIKDKSHWGGRGDVIWGTRWIRRSWMEVEEPQCCRIHRVAVIINGFLSFRVVRNQRRSDLETEEQVNYHPSGSQLVSDQVTVHKLP